MNRQHIAKLGVSLILLCLIGFGVSCRDKELITGTVIGGYNNGFTSVIVQVDEMFPIGKTLHYMDTQQCRYMANVSTYNNVIQVQGGIYRQGDRISFLCRDFDPENIKDGQLFSLYPTYGLFCPRPDVPIYIITEFNILK